MDLARRRKIQREAARAARAARARGETGHGNQAASAGRPGPTVAAISSRSFEAMQSRALRLFQRSVSRFQVLTEDDFKRVADLSLVPDKKDGSAVNRGGDAGNAGGGDDVGDHNGDGQEQARNPTPSLSASSSRRPSCGNNKDDAGGSCDGSGHRPENSGEEGGRDEEKGAESQPSSLVAVPAAAAILRLLRATVLVLGGCGLGVLPSDKDLWDAVRPMLSDGSLRHRLRHFDRRVGLIPEAPHFEFPVLALFFCLGLSAVGGRFEETTRRSSWNAEPLAYLGEKSQSYQIRHHARNSLRPGLNRVELEVTQGFIYGLRDEYM